MCPNSNNRKGGSCIRIGVRILGNFGGWVGTELREGDDPNQNRIINKERIFAQVTNFSSSGVWRVLWYNVKHPFHNSNTLKFEG